MKSAKSIKWLLVLVGVAVIGGGIFLGGYQTGKSSGRLGRPGGVGQMNNRTDSAGGTFVSGEVIAQDETSVTVKLPNGGSQIIFLADSTTITKSATGVIGDLSTGTQISVSGTKNTDGSLSAKTVQIRPVGLPEGRDGQMPTDLSTMSGTGITPQR